MPPSIPRAPMRRALAAAAVAISAASGFAAERHEILPGDTVFGTVREPGEIHEIDLDAPRGTKVRYAITAPKGSGFGACLTKKGVTCVSLFDERYKPLALRWLSFTTNVTNLPLGSSGTARLVLSGLNERAGDFKVRTKATPGKKFKLRSRADDTKPQTALLFGAYPGFEVSVKVTWKGAPVSITSLVGPDDVPLATQEPPKLRSRSLKQRGFTTQALGDHLLSLDVPEGAVKWTATVTVKGRLPPGSTIDDRVTGEEPPPGVELFSSGSLLPIVVVLNETGGANALYCSSGGDRPIIIGTTGSDCAFLSNGPPATAEEYTLECTDGPSATFHDVVRDQDGRLVSYVIDPIETPAGNGTASFSGFTYVGNRAVGWTEVRMFEGTGRSHTLVISGARLLTNQAYTYTVHHTDPGGTTRRYDFLPFQ